MLPARQQDLALQHACPARGLCVRLPGLGGCLAGWRAGPSWGWRGGGLGEAPACQALSTPTHHRLYVAPPSISTTTRLLNQAA